MSVRLSVLRSSVHLSVRLSVCLSVRSFIHLFARQSRVRACSTTDCCTVARVLKEKKSEKARAGRKTLDDASEPRRTPFVKKTTRSHRALARTLTHIHTHTHLCARARARYIVDPPVTRTSRRRFVGYGSESGRKCGIRSAILKNSAPLKIPSLPHPRTPILRVVESARLERSAFFWSWIADYYQ